MAANILHAALPATALGPTCPVAAEVEMFQEAVDRFFLKVTDVAIAFERDSDGLVVAARVRDRGREMVGKRLN